MAAYESLARAVALLRKVCPGIRLVDGLADTKTALRQTKPIEVELDWIDRKLGRHVEPAEVRNILESLAFGVNELLPGTISVTVPSWRATRDVSIKEDIAEEVGRMIGYTAITPVAPQAGTAIATRALGAVAAGADAAREIQNGGQVIPRTALGGGAVRFGMPAAIGGDPAGLSK